MYIKIVVRILYKTLYWANPDYNGTITEKNKYS